MKEPVSPISRKDQGKYFEWLGRVSAQFATIEVEVFLILSKLIGTEHKDVAYFYADRDSSITRKFDTISSLVKLQPYKDLFSTELKKDIKEAASLLPDLSKKRNNLLHNITTFKRNEDGEYKLQQIYISRDSWMFETKSEYSIDDLYEMWVAFFHLADLLDKINAKIAKELEVDLNP